MAEFNEGATVGVRGSLAHRCTDGHRNAKFTVPKPRPVLFAVDLSSQVTGRERSVVNDMFSVESVVADRPGTLVANRSELGGDPP